MSGDDRPIASEPAEDSSLGQDRGPAEAEVVSLEEALVRRAQAGDQEAMKLLLVRHSDHLYSRVILPRVGQVSAAEDLLKATLITAMEKLSTFRWQGRSIYYWLRQIAVNKVIDYHRHHQRSTRLAQQLAAEPDFPHVASLGPGPELALLAEEERRINLERVHTALNQLNPRYRQAIELRLFDELSREDCAQRLAVSLGTFDVLFFRAMQAFRRVYGEP